MTTEAFARAFRYHKGSVLSPWKDLSGDLVPVGDCQDFAWSVLCIEKGGKIGALKAILTGEAMIWRCWSKVNGAIPRHAVLYLRGKGWIDSTDRFWRDSPKPNRRAYPVGTPVAIGAAWFFWQWMRF